MENVLGEVLLIEPQVEEAVQSKFIFMTNGANVYEGTMSSTGKYRDKAYIRKDILLKLVQYGRLNQTALISYCGLNLKRHKKMLDELENKGLIAKEEIRRGKKRISQYRITSAGIDFFRRILEPYEAMFPRKRG